jgi:hypothetical protein
MRQQQQMSAQPQVPQQVSHVSRAAKSHSCTDSRGLSPSIHSREPLFIKPCNKIHPFPCTRCRSEHMVRARDRARDSN